MQDFLGFTVNSAYFARVVRSQLGNLFLVIGFLGFEGVGEEDFSEEIKFAKEAFSLFSESISGVWELVFFMLSSSAVSLSGFSWEAKRSSDFSCSRVRIVCWDSW